MKQSVKRLSLAALCLCVAACSRTSVATTGANHGPNSWTKPHVLRWTSSEDISTLNPTLNTQGVLTRLSMMTMAWLVRWDRNNNPVPELATVIPTKANGGISKDGLTITYHIRRGVKWSDGAPFSADDVVFSFKAVLNPANNVTSRTGWDFITSMQEPDKYTVVLHLKKPYSPFLETFFSTAGANPCLMPKHILGSLPNINNAPYNALPVGIGPFKYTRWDRGQRVVMVADNLYWRGVPKLKEIDYEIIPNLNTTVTELQSHQLDLWYPASGALYKSQLQSLGGYTAILQPGYLFNHISFNTSRPAVSDPQVRLALKFAMDRQALIDKVGHGIGYLQDQPAPKTAPYYIPGVPLTPFDIQKANGILDAAGWKRGADGVREKNGVRLVLDFVSNTGNSTGDQIIELIRSWWKQIGVGMNVEHYDSALLFASQAQHGILYNGKWDVSFFAWGLDAIGDYSNLFACDQRPPNGQNIVMWCNRRANDAKHDFYAQYDQSGRNKDDAIVVSELEKENPLIVENGREDIFFFNADLKGFHPGAVSPFDDMMNVDI